MNSQPDATPPDGDGTPPTTGPVPTDHAATSTCWRCGKVIITAAMHCPWCRATRGGGAGSGPVKAAAGRSPLETLVGYYSILLVSSVLFGLLAKFAESGDDESSEGHISTLTIALEVVWSIGVLAAVLRMPRPPPLPRLDRSERLTGWALAPPVLVLVLGANYAYHKVLREYIGLEWVERVPIPVQEEVSLGLAIVLVCIQPAVVEEVFFRRQTLGTLRGVMGDRAAVLISSVMFGAAHVGVPLSVPILTVVGLALGYIRLRSGSLWAPMLMHALHNGAVLWMETWP